VTDDERLAAALAEFRGSTTAKLARIEADLLELRSDVRALRDTQARFLGIIGAGAFALPLLIRIFFP
jgi:hypothetical protein